MSNNPELEVIKASERVQKSNLEGVVAHANQTRKMVLELQQEVRELRAGQGVANNEIGAIKQLVVKALQDVYAGGSTEK